MPTAPLAGDLGAAERAVLERYADPNALLRLGEARLSRLIAAASHGHLGAARAAACRAAATDAVELYGAHPAMPYTDLAAEVATQVRQLLRAVQAELAAHAGERELAYRYVDPGALARSLPGLADVGGPAVVAGMGEPASFGDGAAFRSFTGLAPKASETGETDRKGQPMSKSGSTLLRTTFVRAADTARKCDPQLARIYHTQMSEQGKDHLGALCVVAAHLAGRAWAVRRRGMPYVICDVDGIPVDPDRAKEIIAERYTVTPEVRGRRRSRKSPATKAGKAPQQVLTGHDHRARSAVARRPSPSPSSPAAAPPVKRAVRQHHPMSSPPTPSRDDPVTDDGHRPRAGDGPLRGLRQPVPPGRARPVLLARLPNQSLAAPPPADPPRRAPRCAPARRRPPRVRLRHPAAGPAALRRLWAVRPPDRLGRRLPAL